MQGLNQITQQLQNNGQPSAFAGQQALSQVYGNLNQQAGMLSYIDAFKVLMIITFCCLPLLLLMRGAGQGGGGEGGGL